MITGFACRADNPVAETMFVLSYLENGEVYLWGNNPADKLMFTTPTLIEKLPKTVTEVACGSVHVLALTSDGNVSTFNLWYDQSISLPLIFNEFF